MRLASVESRVALAILIAAICAVNVLWIRTNVAPPRMYDDSIYLADSVHLFQTAQQRGLLPFLRECATATKGHPPMIKILPVPLYFLFGAGTAQALYSYTLLIPVFCVYLFLLARELSDSEEIAFLAVAMTTAFPLMYGMWRNVMSEFGTTVAVTACLYHLLRSDGFRNRRHAVIAGLFFGWGMLWKISFPIFVIGPALFLRMRRLRHHAGGVAWFAAAALLVAGPFYLVGGREVIRFARSSAAGTQYNNQWSLGPVFSLRTAMLYWLNLINDGISAYLFALIVVLVATYVVRRGYLFRKGVGWFLGSWIIPPLLFFSFQVLKEGRHLLPALPAIGIAGAALLMNACRGLSRPSRWACVAVLFAWPVYLFASSSFDTPFAPRRDLRAGPFILMTRDLELASLQLIPTYTFPANPVAWPAREIISVIAANAPHGVDPPKVRVVGEHPYLSGLILIYQSVLDRTPILSHGPFAHEDPALSDYSVVVCGPDGKYGPLDVRESDVAAGVADPRNGFQEIGRVPLPSRCDAVIYRNGRTAH
jgi:4-amino-4-deoxy-L-arabinose transferase-like glycosyltransferase